MKNDNKLKKYIFIFFLIILFIPMIQEKFDFIKETELGGYIANTNKDTVLTRQGWFDDNYQKKKESFINESFGFRNIFIKLYNQIRFSVFNTTNADNITICKDNILIETNYIKSFWGEDFIGDSLIQNKTKKLKYIQDKLKEKDIYLIYLLAPGKASFYEEKIPSSFSKKMKKTTNYDVLSKEMIKDSINLIDMRNYFLKIKSSSPYPLYPKCGIHWSGYGITVVADTLFRYMEKLSGLDLIDFYAEKGEITNTKMRATDDDIGKAMNLLFGIKNFDMYYPNIVFKHKENQFKPNLLSIGDSYTLSFMLFYPFFSEIFGEKSQFWYYNKTIRWPEELEKQNIEVKNLNILDEVNKNKFILIVQTEQNLNDIGFGFIERMYPLLHTSEEETENRIQDFIKSIKNDEKWLKSIEEKAIKMNIPIEEMIRTDAIWMLGNE